MRFVFLAHTMESSFNPVKYKSIDDIALMRRSKKAIDSFPTLGNVVVISTLTRSSKDECSTDVQSFILNH